MLGELEELVELVANDSDSTAAAGMGRFFAALADYKLGRRPLIVGVLRGWYGDDNAIVREKMREALCMRLAPHLARVIRRGCERHDSRCRSLTTPRGSFSGSPTI